MATTKAEIRGWLERGKAEGATHVLVVCDQFDWEDYPVFIRPDQNAKEKSKNLGNMQVLMECYDLSLDWETQLVEHRALHF